MELYAMTIAHYLFWMLTIIGSVSILGLITLAVFNANKRLHARTKHRRLA